MQDFFLRTRVSLIANTKQLCLLAQRHVPERFFRKLFVNDDRLGVEVCRDSRHSGAVLGGVNLVIGIGDECWHCAEHHRPGEDCHRRNALRHDDDHSLSEAYALSAQHSGLHSGATPELRKCDGLLFVLVGPEGDERPLAGSRLQRFDEIAVSNHRLVYWIEGEGLAVL